MTTEANIKNITERANQLTGSMSHGEACFTACREAGITESEVPAIAGIVSTALVSLPARKVPGSLQSMINTKRTRLNYVKNAEKRAELEKEISQMLAADNGSK